MCVTHSLSGPLETLLFVLPRQIPTISVLLVGLLLFPCYLFALLLLMVRCLLAEEAQTWAGKEIKITYFAKVCYSPEELAVLSGASRWEPRREWRCPPDRRRPSFQAAQRPPPPWHTQEKKTQTIFFMLKSRLLAAFRPANRKVPETTSDIEAKRKKEILK